MMPRGTTGFDPNVGYQSRLPNPRLVSSTFHAFRNISDSLRTEMLMQFGQFIDHDVVGTAKQDLDCCSELGQEMMTCFNVDLKNDTHFAKLNRTCMQFTRSSFSCQGSTPWYYILSFGLDWP